MQTLVTAVRRNAFRLAISLGVVCAIGTAAVLSRPARHTFPDTTQLPSLLTASDPHITTADARTRWLTDIPCRIPCWEHITPGHSSVDETVQVLQHSAFVDQLTTSRPAPGIGVVKWKWKDTQQEAGFAYYSLQDANSRHLITTMGVTFLTPLRLGDIIKALGEPTLIQASATRTPLLFGATQSPPGQSIQYVLTLFYPARGLSLVAAYGASIQPVLSPDLPIPAITLDDPQQNAFTGLDTRQLATNGIVAWEGYRPFVYYCHSLIDTTSCTAR